MRKIGISLLVLVGLSSANAFQAGGVMLMIFPGAKAVSMGGAFSAISDDATAMYYNVGGLGYFKNIEVHFTHAPWLRTIVDDAYYEYLAAVFPTDIGSFGLSVAYLTPGNVDVYDEDGEMHGSFKPFDVAVTSGYGFQPMPNLGVGVAAKVFYSYLVPEWVMRDILQEPGGGTAVTFALDGGVLWKTPLPGLSLAGVIDNVGPGISYTGSGEKDPLPLFLRLGVAYSPIRTEYHKVTVAFDVHKVMTGIVRDLDSLGTNYVLNEAWTSVGAEYTFYDMISLRFGHFHDKMGYRMGYTFGGGITYGSFKLDIADDSSIYEFNKGATDAKRNLRFTLSFVKAVNLGGPSSSNTDTSPDENQQDQNPNPQDNGSGSGSWDGPDNSGG